MASPGAVRPQCRWDLHHIQGAQGWEAAEKDKETGCQGRNEQRKQAWGRKKELGSSSPPFAEHTGRRSLLCSQARAVATCGTGSS